MSRVIMFQGLLALCVISTPLAGAAQTGGTDLSNERHHFSTQVPANDSDGDSFFKKVKSNDSTFIVKLNTSLFTSLFKPETVFRIVTGGSVNDQRVIWFDIGIGRADDGFRVRSNMTVNMPL